VADDDDDDDDDRDDTTIRRGWRYIRITAVLTGGHFDPFARISPPYSPWSYLHTHTLYIAFRAAAIKHAVRVKARLPGRYIVLYIPRVIFGGANPVRVVAAPPGGWRRYIIIIYTYTRGQTWSADGRRAFLHNPRPTPPPPLALRSPYLDIYIYIGYMWVPAETGRAENRMYL